MLKQTFGKLSVIFAGQQNNYISICGIKSDLNNDNDWF